MPDPQRAGDCSCATFGDLACIAMGGDGMDERFFATVEQRVAHGGEPWWLYLSRCTACGQDWMVAQEERIYDDYFLKRISRADADAIGAGGAWPADFLRYEQVLATGRALSQPCRFFDPFAPSLVWAAEDLRRDRPEITAAELAELLGTTSGHAADLLRPMGRLRRWLWRRARGLHHFPS